MPVLIDPGTYRYYESITQKDQDPPVHNNGTYSTDLIASEAVRFLGEASSEDRPFWLGVAPIAPHSETVQGDNGAVFYPPIPAERHKDLFPGLQVPRTPNFNPDVPSGAGYIKNLLQMNESVLEYNDEFYRTRIQSLQAIDDLIDSIFEWLEANPDVLENTYVFYTTDNGYHIGQHRLPPGKTCSVEEDINIPFYVRGPGVEKGKTVSYATSHTDLVPTFFSLAGIPLREDFDGEPMLITEDQESSSQRSSEHVNVEFWGEGLFEGTFRPSGEPEPLNNTYKTVRVIGDDYDISYTVWCNNEHQFYDLMTDQYQMNNLYEHEAGATAFGYDLDRLISRVDALLLTLKACKGKVCTRPWEHLHPKGNVKSLKDALRDEYDDFYLHQQKRVEFQACKLGYLTEFEQPLEPALYLDAASGRFGRSARWHDWT